MIGMRISIGTKSKDEAEKPFWISFADLMSSLMIMFLLVMSVTLVSITDEVSKKKQKGIDRINQIDEFWGKLAERFKNDPSIKLDKTRYAIDLGELALFPLGESVLTDMQVETLRELTKDKILPEADSDIGKRWLKRVVVEGFTDPTGSYFYNLQLSLDRSLRLLCEILDPNDLSLSSLKETQQKRVRDLFLVGGYSSNLSTHNDSKDRRIELRLEFFAVDESNAIVPVSLTQLQGECTLPRRKSR